MPTFILADIAVRYFVLCLEGIAGYI